VSSVFQPTALVRSLQEDRMDQGMDEKATRPSAAVPVAEAASYDGNKPPHAIEEDIARTRVRLGATIEALEHELAPRRVIENSAEVLRRSLEPHPGPFRDQIRAYAIPLALIATGLGWLFVLRRRSYQPDIPSNFGDAPAAASAANETPSPTPCYPGVIDRVEPVPLVDEKAAI
jgi:hypothetical protein